MNVTHLMVQGLGSGAPRAGVSLDLTTLPRIVAVTGPNGAGKTTLLGAIPGALTREIPTRGSLVELAGAERSARVVVEIDGTRIEQMVDGISGKGETLITRGGAPVIDSAKVTAADAWIAKHFPPPEVLYASLFTPQERLGSTPTFVQAAPSQRKGALLRALGIERLERLASIARDRARAAASDLEVAKGRLSELRAGSVEDAERAVVSAREAYAAAEAELRGARKALVDARNLAAEVVAQLERWQRDRERREELRRRIDAEDRVRLDLEARLERNRAGIAQRDQLRAQVARIEALRERAVELDNAVALAGAESARLRAEVVACVERRSAAEAEHARTGAAITSLELRIDALGAARRAKAEAERLAADADALDREIAAREDQVRALMGEQVLGAEQRVVQLRGGLLHIAHGIESGELGAHDAESSARKTLAADDVAARIAVEMPARRREHLANIEALRAKRVDVSRSWSRAQEAARLLTLEPEMRAELQRLTTRHAELHNALSSAKAEHGALSDLLRWSDLRSLEKRAQREQVGCELSELGGAPALLAKIEGAEERIAEYEASLAASRERLAEMRAERDAIPEPDADTVAAVSETEPYLPKYEHAERVAAERCDQLSRAEAVACARLMAAQEEAERRAGLEAEVSRLATLVGDLTLLARDLGRDGIQALAIDAAGPELTSTINDLLHACIGTRWTVAIETTRLLASGKGERESLEIRVIDTQTGREGPIESFSGGEKVILSEACSLALTMVVCRRYGLRSPTICRDESAAALSAEMGPRYVAMLRRAADHIGASRVLVVTHDERVADACDGRLEVSDSGARFVAQGDA